MPFNTFETAGGNFKIAAFDSDRFSIKKGIAYFLTG
jgi:hypothetical protein